MIKNKQSGFSLAEILISLGILSIIATMGFTIAKKGLESAYNNYVYTGYKALSDAFAEAYKQGYDIVDDRNDAGTDLNSDFLKSLINTLEAKDDGANYKFKTTNGIYYYIRKTGASISGNSGANPNSTMQIYIEMYVPTVDKKKYHSKGRLVCMYYDPLKYPGIIMPFDSNARCSGDYENIQKRKDLISFYLDDGEVGRVPPKNKEMLERKHYSLDDAYCLVYGDKVANGATINGVSPVFIDCQNYTNKKSKKGSSILYVNPKKIL